MVNDCQLGVLPSVQLFFAEARAAKTQLKFLFCYCLFQCLFVCFIALCPMSTAIVKIYGQDARWRNEWTRNSRHREFGK